MKINKCFSTMAIIAAAVFGMAVCAEAEEHDSSQQEFGEGQQEFAGPQQGSGEAEQGFGRARQGAGGSRYGGQFVCPKCGWSSSRGQDKEGGSNRQKGFDKEKKFERIAQELGLTEEQLESMKQQQAVHREKVKNLKKDMKAKKMELRTELEKWEADESTVAALLGEIKLSMEQQLDLQVEGTLAMKELLTAEQYEKFKTLIRKKHKKKRDGKSRGGKPGHDKSGSGH